MNFFKRVNKTMKLICSFTSHQKPSITNCLSLSELPINKCSISIMIAAGGATGRFISGLELLQRLHKSLIKNDKYPVISQSLHKFFIKKKNNKSVFQISKFGLKRLDHHFFTTLHNLSHWKLCQAQIHMHVERYILHSYSFKFLTTNTLSCKLIYMR